jgi:hypothetical protein
VEAEGSTDFSEQLNMTIEPNSVAEISN